MSYSQKMRKPGGPPVPGELSATQKQREVKPTEVGDLLGDLEAMMADIDEAEEADKVAADKAEARNQYIEANRRRTCCATESFKAAERRLAQGGYLAQFD